MRPEQITDIVERTGQLAAGHYVFPEIGQQLARVLGDRLAEGRYESADGPEALGKLVTEDLQSVNGDKHLRLKHHVIEIEEQADDPAEAEFRRQAAATMGGVARVQLLAGNIGHLELRPVLFPPSMAGEAVIGAMQLLADTDGLILDARGLVGGDPEMGALLCGYLFDEPAHLTDIYERAGDHTRQLWTSAYVPGRRFGAGKPVYVLTSAATFSGGEALAYDLRQLGRATVVGERTGGGAHPRIGVRVHPHLEFTVPVARSVNPVSGTNWEGTGVVPDVEVPAADALDTAHRRLLDRLTPVAAA